MSTGRLIADFINAIDPERTTWPIRHSEWTVLSVIDLGQCGPRYSVHNYNMDFGLAVLLMVGMALAYFLSRMLWHWRQV
jgi:hypothetical protein